MAEYWLISAPGDKTCQQTFETMNNVTSKQNNLCANFKFHIPDLKVGTLDQLVGLSDDLGKLDSYVEASTRKVAQYLGEVLEDQRDKLHENLLANNSSEQQDDVNLEDDTGGGYNNTASAINNNNLVEKTKNLPHCGCVELLCRQCYEMGREMNFITMIGNNENITDNDDNNKMNEKNNLTTLINNNNNNNINSNSNNKMLKNNLIINIQNNNNNNENIIKKSSSKDKMTSATTTPAATTPTGTSTFDWWFHKNKKYRNSISKIEQRRHSATATITTNCKTNENCIKSSLSGTSSSSSTGNACGSPTTIVTNEIDFNLMRKHRSKSLAINRTIHPRLSTIGSCCIKSDNTNSIDALNDKAVNDNLLINPMSYCDDDVATNIIDNKPNNVFTFSTPLQSPVCEKINYDECFKKQETTAVCNVLTVETATTSPSADTNTTNNSCQPQIPLSPGDLPSYITRFQWDMAKYPIKQSLRNIADIISKQVGQIDADLKTKSAAYNNLKGNLQNLEKKQTGSLLTRNLADLVKKEHFILDSEYLTTLLVIVPKTIAGDWNAGYERITDMIVPRSSQMIIQDQDFALYTVTLFKKVVDEFKLHAREKKFVVRDFTYNEEELAAGKNEITKLVTDKKKQFGPLVRWLKVNFSECFCAWVHVKALRVFVESVLRYGLPVNFQAILIQPHKKSQKRLRDVLQQLYGHLDGSGSSSVNHAADNVDIPGLGFGQAEYFPYVCYKLSIDMVETKI